MKLDRHDLLRKSRDDINFYVTLRSCEAATSGSKFAAELDPYVALRAPQDDKWQKKYSSAQRKNLAKPGNTTNNKTSPGDCQHGSK
jgi:hypothetical protein